MQHCYAPLRPTRPVETASIGKPSAGVARNGNCESHTQHGSEAEAKILDRTC